MARIRLAPGMTGPVATTSEGLEAMLGDAVIFGDAVTAAELF